MLTMTHDQAPIDRIRHAKRRGVRHNRTAIRRRPLVEILEGRMLLAVAFDPVTATFTGDGTAHTLLLSESSGDLAYTVDPDTDPNAVTVVTTVPISATAPPTITVALGDANTDLRLDASWTFTDPITFTGGAGTNTLDDETGTADTWNLTDSNDGNINGSVTFTGVEVAIDSGRGTLIGGAADSTWNFATTQTYAAAATPANTLTFSGFGSLQGGAGANTFLLTGDGITNVVNANLDGGAGNNIFDFSNGTQLNGNVVGGPSNNTLDYSSYGFGAAVTLTGAGDNGYSGTEASSIFGTFEGIDGLVGANSGGDELTGLNLANTWSLGTTPSYRAAGGPGLLFSGFNDLEGGMDTDDFVVTAAQPEITALDGNGGDNTLDLSGYATGDSVILAGTDPNGFTGTTISALGGAFTGIDQVIGASGDTLGGDNNASTWALAVGQTYDDGTGTLDFSGFTALQGGTGTDDFVVTTATPDTINGGGGVNTLDLSGFATGQAVALTGSLPAGFSGDTSSSTGAFAVISDIIGASGDTLGGDNNASTWAARRRRLRPTTMAQARWTSPASPPSMGGIGSTDDFVVTTATPDTINGGGGVTIHARPLRKAFAYLARPSQG